MGKGKRKREESVTASRQQRMRQPPPEPVGAEGRSGSGHPSRSTSQTPMALSPPPKDRVSFASAEAIEYMMDTDPAVALSEEQGDSLGDSVESGEASVPSDAPLFVMDVEPQAIDGLLECEDAQPAKRARLLDADDDAKAASPAAADTSLVLGVDSVLSPSRERVAVEAAYREQLRADAVRDTAMKGAGTSKTRTTPVRPTLAPAEPFLAFSSAPRPPPKAATPPPPADTAPLPPWASKEYAHENAYVNLHNELVDFTKFMMPTDAEKKMRDDLVEELTLEIQALFPGAEVHVFGSAATGLCLPTSDIDMVVMAPSVRPKRAIYTLAETIAHRTSHLEVIKSTKVPLVKFVDKRTKCPVDISFNQTDGMVALPTIRGFMEQYPACVPLVLFLKYFLHVRSLNEVYRGGLGSYAITNLVISFLQHRDTPVTADSNMGLLLVSFFHLYGIRFNYLSVGISTRGQGSYFPKESRPRLIQDRDPLFRLCLEDPVDQSNNIGVKSYNIAMIRAAFQHAYRCLTTEGWARDGRTKLEQIVAVDPDVLSWRRHIRHLFGDVSEVEELSSDTDDTTEDDVQILQYKAGPPSGYKPAKGNKYVNGDWRTKKGRKGQKTIRGTRGGKKKKKKNGEEHPNPSSKGKGKDKGKGKGKGKGKSKGKGKGGDPKRKTKKTREEKQEDRRLQKLHKKLARDKKREKNRERKARRKAEKQQAAAGGKQKSGSKASKKSKKSKKSKSK